MIEGGTAEDAFDQSHGNGALGQAETPSADELAAARAAEARVARWVGRPLGIAAFVVGAGLAIAAPALIWAAAWLFVAAFGLAAWREATLTIRSLPPA